MNTKQKSIIFVCGLLFVASLIFAPHHANGTGDMMFRPIGTKKEIPFSDNKVERQKIQEELEFLAAKRPDLWGNTSLNEYSRDSAKYTRQSDLDYTAGFSGWPVPNFTMLGTFWVVLAVSGSVAWLYTKNTKEA